MKIAAEMKSNLKAMKNEECEVEESKKVENSQNEDAGVAAVPGPYWD